MRYRKIGKKHPDWERLQACRQAGLWMCDALTHNSHRGCSNPQCFKFFGGAPAISPMTEPEMEAARKFLDSLGFGKVRP